MSFDKWDELSREIEGNLNYLDWKTVKRIIGDGTWAGWFSMVRTIQ